MRNSFVVKFCAGIFVFSVTTTVKADTLTILEDFRITNDLNDVVYLGDAQTGENIIKIHLMESLLSLNLTFPTFLQKVVLR